MTTLRALALAAILLSLFFVPAEAAPTPTSGFPAPTSAPDPLGGAQAAGAIDFVQRIGGRYNYSFIDGDTAYLLGGGQLLSVDIGEPAAPAVIDRMFMPVSGAFAVDAGHAYVFGAQGGMSVVDLGDPAALEVVSVYPPASLPRSWSVVESQIEGQTLYLLTRQIELGRQLTLRMIDIADPANPREIGMLDLADQVFYSRNHLSVAGGYAAVRSGGAGDQVNIIDISDPQALHIVSSFVPLAEAGIGELYIQDQRAYVFYLNVSHQGFIDVYDLTTPAQPQKIGGYTYPLSFWLMAAEGNAAYVAGEGLAGERVLRMIDFTVPSAPVVASIAQDSTYLQTLAVRAGRVVEIGEGQGEALLSTFDFSNPAAVRKLGRLAVSSFSGAAPMALSGDTLYAYETRIDAPSRITQYSLANPLEPTVVITAPMHWVTSIAVGDSALYMGNWANAITVVDRANLAAPPLVIDYPFANREPSRLYWIQMLAARGKRAYALADYKRLEVIDFTTPAAPRVLGAFANGDQHMAPVIAGETAWFIDGSAQGSCIARGIDLSNPANLRVIGSLALAPALDCGAKVKLVGATEDVLYAWSDSFLTAIDVSNPGAPRIQAALKLDTFVQSLWVEGEFLYADTQNGVVVFDHATPDRLDLVASIELGLNSSPEVPSSVMGRAGAIYRGGYGIVVLHWNPMIARGAVRQTNGLPFAAASIAASTGAVQSSAGDGAFLFKNLPRGPVTFTPSRPGYTFWPLSRTINLPSSGAVYFQVTAAPVAATLPPGTVSSLTVTDTQGLTGTFALDTTALSVTSSVAITFTPSPATMFGSAFAGHAFELAVDPAVAVTATIRYSTTDLRVASDPAALALWRWTGAAWEQPDCAAAAIHDQTARAFTVGVCRPGAYALFAPSRQLLLPFMAKE